MKMKLKFIRAFCKESSWTKVKKQSKMNETRRARLRRNIASVKRKDLYKLLLECSEKKLSCRIRYNEFVMKNSSILFLPLDEKFLLSNINSTCCFELCGKRIISFGECHSSTVKYGKVSVQSLVRSIFKHDSGIFFNQNNKLGIFVEKDEETVFPVCESESVNIEGLTVYFSGSCDEFVKEYKVPKNDYPLTMYLCDKPELLSLIISMENDYNHQPYFTPDKLTDLIKDTELFIMIFKRKFLDDILCINLLKMPMRKHVYKLISKVKKITLAAFKIIKTRFPTSESLNILNNSSCFIRSIFLLVKVFTNDHKVNIIMNGSSHNLDILLFYRYMEKAGLTNNEENYFSQDISGLMNTLERFKIEDPIDTFLTLDQVEHTKYFIKKFIR